MVTIGKVLKPIGLHGEVKVELLTDFPERFDGLHNVTLLTKTRERIPYKIAGVRHVLPFVYLKFEGLGTVSDVDFLRDAYLQVPESERVSLPEGSYFHSDLIGMEVYTQDKTRIGRVKDILETGSNDVLVVQGGKGETLIPAIKKFVNSVDLKRKQINIHVIEGLLDL